MKNDALSEQTIDYYALKKIVTENRYLFFKIIVGCSILGLILALVLPKKYESTTLVQTRNVSQDGNLGQLGSIMGMSSNANTTNTYMELMKSRKVLEPIIEKLDVSEEDKKYLTAERFAKGYLKITNVVDTNLIKITAIGKTPEEAQQISRDVINNFIEMQTLNGKETHSLLVDMLTNEIEDAKKNAEEARSEFANFQSKNAIYHPSEQSKTIVSRMGNYDKLIAEMKAKEVAEKAALEVIVAKLGEIRNDSLNYSINDNENVLKIRTNIVNKQIELVDLRQVYTDDHPSVVAKERELQELNALLAKEVSSVVNASSTSISANQASLYLKKATAEAEIGVAKATEEAADSLRKKFEKEAENFPDKSMEYLRLQREVSIREELYTSLVKQCEDNKFKEAMDSMDVQVVDDADYPIKASFPKKSIFMILGFLIGCFVSVGYVIRKYVKEIG